MIEILEDLHALQHFRDTSDADCTDSVSVIHLDNHQAWIESRLYWCSQVTDKDDGMLMSCVLTSYSVHTPCLRASGRVRSFRRTWQVSSCTFYSV